MIMFTLDQRVKYNGQLGTVSSVDISKTLPVLVVFDNYGGFRKFTLDGRAEINQSIELFPVSPEEDFTSNSLTDSLK